MVKNIDRRGISIIAGIGISFLITLIFKKGKDPIFIFLFFTFLFFIFWGSCEAFLSVLLHQINSVFLKNKFKSLSYTGKKEEIEDFFLEELEEKEEPENNEVKFEKSVSENSFFENKTEKKIKEIIEKQSPEKISNVIRTWLLEER
jgi:flagellar biosynthesis/type III secretory pathway M-ring protein FliF/YscJ